MRTQVHLPVLFTQLVSSDRSYAFSASDMGLEYEDNDLYRSFRDFYYDIVPEFKSVGRVVNIKVCCNHEPHLRGNVYVQYRR